MKIFGFNIGKDKELVDDPHIGQASPEALPEIEESMGGFGGKSALDSSAIDFVWHHQNELISKYRGISTASYVESAIDDIVDETIVLDDNSSSIPVLLNLDNSLFSDNVKDKINKEWEYFQSSVYNFRERLEMDFREWYIDGQKSFYLIAGDKNKKEGLKEMRSIDSLYIEQIVKRTPIGNTKSVKLEAKWLYDITAKLKKLKGQRLNNAADSLFFNTAEIFNDGRTTSMDKIEIEPDAIAHSNSGIRDENGLILSYLHRAIQPFNTITNFENSILIYTIVRAPQRRMFFVDTGLLKGKKAESYVNGLMKKHRNKMVLDTESGDLKGAYNIRSMLEDYWLPRQEGSRGTDVQTLDGGGQLTSIDFVNNFKKNLWEALRTPASRRGEDPSLMMLGRGTEVSREEIKFKKFTNRIVKRFSRMYIDAFLTHLILKKMISIEEKKQNLSNMFLVFGTDNHFKEIKDNEILQGRLEVLETIEPYVGKYFSEEYVMTVILKMTEEQAEEMLEKIEEEKIANEAKNKDKDMDDMESDEEGGSKFVQNVQKAIDQEKKGANTEDDNSQEKSE